MDIQFTNIREAVNKIRRSPNLKNIPFETLVDYAVDFMRIVDVPTEFLDKTAILDVHNYRAALPCDYFKLISVRTAECHHRYYRYTTDSFHMSPNHKEPDNLTYKLQGGGIYTSTEHGKIEIVYKAIALDEEGFPMIPDTAKFQRAFEWYVKLQHYTNLFEEGKIADKILINTQTEYSWAVGAFESEMRQLNIDQAESLSNIWNNLIIDVSGHRSGYRHINDKELIRRH